MKSSKKVITVFEYRRFYAPGEALMQLVEEAVRDVPDADYIEVTAVNLFDAPQEGVRDEVRPPELQRAEEMRSGAGEA